MALASIPVIGSAISWGARLLGGVGGGRGLIFGAAAAAVVGIGLYVLHLNSELEEARKAEAAATADTRVAVEANRELTIALEEARDQFRRATAALEAERAAFEERVRALDAIREEIRNAPPSDDGPVPPVLERTLDRLRELSGASGRDEAQGSEAASAEKPADVSADTDTAGE